MLRITTYTNAKKSPYLLNTCQSMFIRITDETARRKILRRCGYIWPHEIPQHDKIDLIVISLYFGFFSKLHFHEKRIRFNWWCVSKTHTKNIYFANTSFHIECTLWMCYCPMISVLILNLNHTQLWQSHLSNRSRVARIYQHLELMLPTPLYDLFHLKRIVSLSLSYRVKIRESKWCIAIVNLLPVHS